jgi:hypothetical protein
MECVFWKTLTREKARPQILHGETAAFGPSRHLPQKGTLSYGVKKSLPEVKIRCYKK